MKREKIVILYQRKTYKLIYNFLRIIKNQFLFTNFF